MRALLVDDHHLFREGLKFLLADLAPGMQFEEANSIAAALSHAHGRQIDLLLLDLHMPGAVGLGALDAVRVAFDMTSIVVLSSEDDPRLIRASIERGAAGFVPKSSTPQLLIAALRLILAGGAYLPAHVLRAMPFPPSLPSVAAGSATIIAASMPIDAAAAMRAGTLSPRQREVLLKAVQGKANKVIAREMKLSEGTVKAHLSAAFRALGVQNRTEAVFVAAQSGLTPSTGMPASVRD